MKKMLTKESKINFINIKTGTIAENFLCRSSSPLKGGNARAGEDELGV